MIKTKFASYCINGIAEGCKYCVRGRKLVLFITGKCSRNCFYCSLSSKRKNKDIIFANERKCKSIKGVIEESKESNSQGAGITGGDPLLFINRTIRYAKALKQQFKNFHTHIYLPTTLVTKKNLKRLSSCIDEVRFHPSFLEKPSKKESEEIIQKDIEKVKLANLFFKKQNIGCEFPVLPDKKQAIFEFIKKASSYLGFVNLNEFEISDTNFDYVTKHYSLNQDTYTIAKSKEASLWILRQCEKAKLKISVHVCTAKTKNHHQYKNRLKLRRILPYGYRTEDGTVRYFAIYTKNRKELNRIAKELRRFKQIYIDKNKLRITLSESIVPLLLNLKKYKIARVEEFPTFDRIEIEFEYI